jgi:hypothetical protein
MNCAACGNELKIFSGKCVACGVSGSEARGQTRPMAGIPRVNQVSGRDDEKPFKCRKCGSFNIHFCNIHGSLRCKNCSKLLKYEEAIDW